VLSTDFTKLDLIYHASYTKHTPASHPDARDALGGRVSARSLETATPCKATRVYLGNTKH